MVAPDLFSYQAKVGRRTFETFEIVRSGATSFRRDPARAWRKLTANKNRPPAPTEAMLAVHERLASVSTSAGGVVNGTLSPEDAGHAGHAGHAGLASGPGVTAPVAVSLTLDYANHVLHFEATVKIAGAKTNATLKTQTDFASFDTGPAITAPI